MKPQRKLVDVATVKKMLAKEKEQEVLYFDKLRLDPASGIVSVGRKAIELPLTETNVLAALMLKKGKLLQKWVVYDLLYWNRSGKKEPTHKTVDTWIHYLRQHIKPLGYGLHNQYSFGWKLIKLNDKAKKVNWRYEKLGAKK